MGVCNAGTLKRQDIISISPPPQDSLHLYVLRGLLGDVLLRAVVQDALHSEASHSVDSWSDGEGVLREQLSTNGIN